MKWPNVNSGHVTSFILTDLWGRGDFVEEISNFVNEYFCVFRTKYNQFANNGEEEEIGFTENTLSIMFSAIPMYYC